MTDTTLATSPSPRRIRLFRVAGMDVEVHLLTLLLVGFLGILLATGILPEQAGAPALTPLAYAAMGALGAVGLFACVMLHELAHAVAARCFGERVERVIVFPHAVPGEEPTSPFRELVVAGSGPAMTLVLAGACQALSLLLRDARLATLLFSFLALSNLLFGVTFLLPALPLDGGRMLRAVLWGITGRRLVGTRWACVVGRSFAVMLGVGCAALAAWQGVSTVVVWGILLALVLWVQAGTAWRTTRVRESLRGLVAADVMESSPTPLPRAMSVADALVGAMRSASPALGRTFLVERNGRLGGLVTLATLRHVPEDEAPGTPVGQVMRRLCFEHVLEPGSRLEGALARMTAFRVTLLPVVHDGRLLGIVTRDRILRLVEGVS